MESHGREDCYRATHTDIHLDAKQSISVRMCAEHKFCVHLFSTDAVYFYSEDLFFVTVLFYQKRMQLPTDTTTMERDFQVTQSHPGKG